MNWTVESRHAPGFTRLVLAGAYDKQQFTAMFDELAAQDLLEIGGRYLIDQTRFDIGQMSDLDLLHASDTFISLNSKLAYSKIAILANPEYIGLGRKFEKITEFASMALIEVFDSELPALLWLTGGLVRSLSQAH